MGINDVRLIALDAKTGMPCADFGKGGEIKLAIGMRLDWPGEFQITSPPAVGRGVVVVGSSIGDNSRVDAPSGMVRAFDARSGEPRWTFEPLQSDNLSLEGRAICRDRRQRRCVPPGAAGRGAVAVVAHDRSSGAALALVFIALVIASLRWRRNRRIGRA